MTDSSSKRTAIENLLLVLFVGMLMVACGIGAYVLAMILLMDLGSRFHGNYEYYGQTLAIALIFVAGALGFLAPGIVVWYLLITKQPLRFSLRTLLVAMTIVAVLLAVFAVFRQ
jgi:hypothetical protein